MDDELHDLRAIYFDFIGHSEAWAKASMKHAFKIEINLNWKSLVLIAPGTSCQATICTATPQGLALKSLGFCHCIVWTMEIQGVNKNKNRTLIAPSI